MEDVPVIVERGAIHPPMGRWPFPYGALAISLWGVGNSPIGRLPFPYRAFAVPLQGVCLAAQVQDYQEPKWIQLTDEERALVGGSVD